MKHIIYRILATLMFFTRLPLWKIANVPADHFKKVVPMWPMVGWLTGGLMAVVYVCTAFFWHSTLPIILALLTRVLLTGALHEDGFADFCDGFGGGTTKERTLEIMKDSHIGTYGVLGLILYYITIIATIDSISKFFYDDFFFTGALLLCGDTFCKWTSSTIIYTLPYARKEEEAKSKLVYSSVSWWEKAISILLGVLPIIVIANYSILIVVVPSAIASFITCCILFRKMKKRIQGYTGDCCGATFIISEAVFYIVSLLTITIFSLPI